MIPDNAIDQIEENRDRNHEAFDHLVNEIKNDSSTTDREKKLLSALVALRNQ